MLFQTLKLLTSNVLILILFGCVINPKYSDPDYMFENQKIESPEHVAQIQKNKEAYEQWHSDQIVKPLPKESYEVIEDETSRWSIGKEKELLHIGETKYNYHHKIRIRLVCDKMNFIPIPLTHRVVKWKISDTLLGETQTNKEGYLDFHISSLDSKKFVSIDIKTKYSDYKIPLDSDLIIDGTKEECGKRKTNLMGM